MRTTRPPRRRTTGGHFADKGKYLFARARTLSVEARACRGLPRRPGWPRPPRVSDENVFLAFVLQLGAPVVWLQVEDEAQLAHADVGDLLNDLRLAREQLDSHQPLDDRRRYRKIQKPALRIIAWLISRCQSRPTTACPGRRTREVPDWR